MNKNIDYKKKVYFFLQNITLYAYCNFLNKIFISNCIYSNLIALTNTATTGNFTEVF